MIYIIHKLKLLFIILCIFTISYTQQKKILLVVHKFPKLTETFILSQIKGFLQEGYELSIISREKDETLIIHQDIIDYKLLKCTKYIDFYDTKNYDILHNMILEHDIVYCQYDRIGCVFADIKQRKNYTAKLVVCVRGWPMEGNRMQKEPQKYAILFKEADIILPVCNYFKNELIKYGCPSEKIIVHHSAIDCEKIKYKKRDSAKKIIDIISVARLIESKGIDQGIKAIANLIYRYPNIRYTIIGGGKLYDSLKNLIKYLNMNKNIILLGWQPHNIIIKKLYEADIFLHPSTGCEGIPNAIMEAMAVGLPIVSTNVNGIPEIVNHGQNGFIVKPKMKDELVDALKLLIGNKKLRLTMGLNGRSYVEKEHNINLENKKLIKLFEKL